MSRFLAIVFVVLAAGLFVACGTQSESTPARTVTINGSDGVGGIIDPINLWDDYATRSKVVARVHPGDTVQLIRRSGDGALVETRDGTRGWLNASFINE